MTGLHVISSIVCKVCKKVLGWKYVSLFSFKFPKFWQKVEAYEEDQKYKVGKFILERAKIKKSFWDVYWNIINFNY